MYGNQGGPKFASKFTSRAFDKVDRGFILNILHLTNFPLKWINMIKECITTQTFSIILNGGAVGYFGSTCGLIQEDPPFSHLFAIAMEAISSSLEKAVNLGCFSIIKPNKDCTTSHLVFVDDLLIFGKGDPKYIENDYNRS